MNFSGRVLGVWVAACGFLGCDATRENNVPPPGTSESGSRAVELLADQIMEALPGPGRVAMVGPPRAEEEDWSARLQSRLRREDPAWVVRRISRADLEIRTSGDWAFLVAVDGDVEGLREKDAPLIAVVDEAMASSYLEQVYRAHALVEVSVRGSRVLTHVPGDSGISEEVFNTRLGRLRGTRFQVLLEERYNLLWDAHGRPTRTEERPSIGRVSYERLRQSRLLRITAESDDPLIAAISANAAAETAAGFFQEENRRLSDAAVQWLDRQAEVQKKMLDQTAAALLAFRKEHNLETLQTRMEADRQALIALRQKGTMEENDNLRKKIDELTRSLAVQETALAELQARHRSLIRERDAAEAALNSVLARTEQARMAVDRDTATLTVVERATRPADPVRRLIPGVTGLLLRVEGPEGLEYDWIAEP